MGGNLIKTMLRSLLLFVAAALVLLALLVIAKRVPTLKQQNFIRQYASVEEVKRVLELDRVLVPTYFPEGVAWPPTVILAQKKPYEAVIMEFRKAEKAETTLVIIQSSLQGRYSQLERIPMVEVKEETTYPLKGRRAELQVGTCPGGTACSRISWDDSGLHCTVLFMAPPFELIKIAESMIH
jgi:hypothetical protein